METIIKPVRDLPASDRSTFERVVGHQLRENQQLVIQVVNMQVPIGTTSSTASATLPEWCRIYEGESDERIEEIERAIVRQHTTRTIHP